MPKWFAWMLVGSAATIAFLIGVWTGREPSPRVTEFARSAD